MKIQPLILQMERTAKSQKILGQAMVKPGRTGRRGSVHQTDANA